MRSILRAQKNVVEENCTKGEARLQFSGTRAAERRRSCYRLLGDEKTYTTRLLILLYLIILFPYTMPAHIAPEGGLLPPIFSNALYTFHIRFYNPIFRTINSETIPAHIAPEGGLKPPKYTNRFIIFL